MRELFRPAAARLLAVLRRWLPARWLPGSRVAETAATRWVRASAEMRQGFGLDRMEPPRTTRAWFESLFGRYPFSEEAIGFFRTLRLEAGDLSAEWGGGFWWGDQRLVQIRGAQDEAAIHELAHAFWHGERERGANARELMEAVTRLADEPDPRYGHAQRLAHDYVHGIPTQADPSSPTGYWRGMLVEENDWEMFAGLASGTMADMRLLPPYVRRFYSGLFKMPAGETEASNVSDGAAEGRG